MAWNATVHMPRIGYSLADDKREQSALDPRVVSLPTCRSPSTTTADRRGIGPPEGTDYRGPAHLLRTLPLGSVIGVR